MLIDTLGIHKHKDVWLNLGPVAFESVTQNGNFIFSGSPMDFSLNYAKMLM